LSGHTALLYAVAFTPDSKRVVTGSDDHTLRLWRVQDGAPIATLKGHTDRVRALAVSPQNGTIVSGSWDHSIRLWDGQTGQFIKTLANQDTQVAKLSFSPDGRYLLSGVGDGPNNDCHVWSFPAGKELINYQGHDNTVLATAISPDGQWAATGGGSNHEIHIWSLPDGKLQKHLRGVGASNWAVGFSSDGQTLAWGKSIQLEWQVNDYGPLEYRLTLPTSDRPFGSPKKISPDENFRRAQTQWNDWNLRSPPDQNAVLEIRHQESIKAQIERYPHDGYEHRTYTFTPDGQHIISGGGNGYLSIYKRNGEKLGDYTGHTGDIWAVAVSPDGGLLASASDDQTVRLWNLQSRDNLLTLFHGSDGEWVAWTPSGYYIASPDGDQMIGWQINHGADKAADYVKVAQMRHTLYRPNIVANVVRQRIDIQTKVSEITKLPDFKILSPEYGSTITQQQIELKLSLSAVKTIEIYVNDRLVIPRGENALAPNHYKKTLIVRLEPGKNHLRIVAKNSIGETEKNWEVYFEGEAPENQGDLYLVAIGVSDYQDDRLDLNYAAADAHAVHDIFVAQQGKKYKKVNSVLLAAPTSSKIKETLDLFDKAGEDDTVILFLAGHGVNEDGEYYFLPYDAHKRQNRWQKSSVVKWQTLQDKLEKTRGRRILLVDTCHSGNAFNSRLVKDAADANIVVISATDRDSKADERHELKHGIFTYALLEGLNGKADLISQDKLITIKELDAYLSDKIKKLSNGHQEPVLHAPGGFKDFVFARL